MASPHRPTVSPILVSPIFIWPIFVWLAFVLSALAALTVAPPASAAPPSFIARQAAQQGSSKPPASRPPAATQPRWHTGKAPCWDAAGAYQGIDPWLLYAIAYVESSYDPYSVSPPNADGTRDLGLMQINSSWLPTLAAYGIPRQTLFDACASTYIGAWILADGFRRYGYSWKAIASYNTGDVESERKRRLGYAYATRVYRAYARLTAGR